MQIREATKLDIPEILEVLKASLGETSSHKTKSVWRYKHIKNPFGESLVLLACIEQKIIGVRAFMRWQWNIGTAEFSAFRAVDTATHPDHQGKGVFKKLTLEALEIGKEEGDNFVFNTPNPQSKPGYLKMGWEEMGKIKLSIKPSNPLNLFLSTKKPEYSVNSNASHEELDDLLKTYNTESQNKNLIFTPKSRAFLRWRYEENALQDYQVYYSKNLYLAVYLKSRGKLNELRISECIYVSEVGKKEVKKIIKTWNKKFRANLVSYNIPSNNLFRFSLKGNYGPVLTLKEIQLQDVGKLFFLDLNNWNYSLGDLELF